MACPKCGNQFGIQQRASVFNDGHHVETYQCPLCDTLWTWESIRLIDKEVLAPEADDYIDRLAELRKKLKEQEEQLAREQEEQDDNED